MPCDLLFLMDDVYSCHESGSAELTCHVTIRRASPSVTPKRTSDICSWQPLEPQTVGTVICALNLVGLVELESWIPRVRRAGGVT
jgi:hypothetical protein